MLVHVGEGGFLGEGHGGRGDGVARGFGGGSLGAHVNMFGVFEGTAAGELQALWSLLPLVMRALGNAPASALRG